MTTYHSDGSVTKNITENQQKKKRDQIAEARSVFETPEQKKSRENKKYLDNVDRVLRPKKA